MSRVKADFEFYIDRIVYWTEHRLGLTDWRKYYEFETESPDADADIYWLSDSRVVTFGLNKTKCPIFDKQPKEAELKAIDKSAFHEAVHLLLADLFDLARQTNEKLADKYSEAIIARLENGVFEELIEWETSKRGDIYKAKK